MASGWVGSGVCAARPRGARVDLVSLHPEARRRVIDRHTYVRICFERRRVDASGSKYFLIPKDICLVCWPNG